MFSFIGLKIWAIKKKIDKRNQNQNFCSWKDTLKKIKKQATDLGENMYLYEGFLSSTYENFL